MPRGQRAVEWQGIAIDESVGTGVSSIAVVTADTLTEDYTHPTIIRIQGCLQFRLNASTTSASETTRYMAALGVFNQNLPDANTSPQDLILPWMWVCSGEVFMPQGGSAYWNGSNVLIQGVGVGAQSRQRVEAVDTKAMRKVRTDEELRLAFWTDKSSGSPGDLAVSGHVRVLIKE